MRRNNQKSHDAPKCQKLRTRISDTRRLLVGACSAGMGKRGHLPPSGVSERGAGVRSAPGGTCQGRQTGEKLYKKTYTHANSDYLFLLAYEEQKISYH